MLHQMPAVSGFNTIGATTVGDQYRLVCCDQVQSRPPYRFTYLLAVYDLKTKEPIYFVAAEENLGRDEWGGPSHFLCIYDRPGHLTLAASDQFADADVFFPEAMRLVATRFGVSLGTGTK